MESKTWAILEEEIKRALSGPGESYYPVKPRFRFVTGIPPAMSAYMPPTADC